MQLADALILVKRLVLSGEKHQDYTRTVDLADTYLTYITGLGIERKLKKFVPRESDVMFTQRVELTKAITPAISSSLKTPFSKVTRNNRIKTDIKLENNNRQASVDKMLKGFYGAPQKKNRGLTYWMNTRFLELNFSDPNAWIVVEWDNPADDATVVQPRPFEVSAAEAVNYYAANDVVKWLFVKQEITILAIDTVPVQPNSTVPGYVQPATIANEPKKTQGCRFTLYDEDVTVVFEQVDPAYLKQIGYVYETNEQLVVVGKYSYIIRFFETNLGFPPVYRVGYKRDEATKGRTFVNPWHDALCYFDKSLKTVSELDLTMTLHAFPQKIQYVQKCVGPSRQQRCNNGILTDGKTCPSCNGSGYKVATSAQDAILLPMPETKDELIPLDDILVYKSPPIDIIEFQNDYINQLERQAHQAVFNSQVLVQSKATNVSGQNTVKTATEINTNLDSVYDALEPFTEKYSEFYMDIALTMGVLTGEQLEKIDVTHEFPADYKMKGEDLLLAERAEASQGGAPSFLLQQIDDDLAAIVYQGDDEGFQVYKTQRKYFPFTGMSPDEIALAVTSPLVPKADKVLWFNFGQIFTLLLEENPDFYKMTDAKKQRTAVEEMTKRYMEKVAAENPSINADTLRNTNPIAGNPPAGGGPAGEQPGDNNPGQGASNP
jgi:hypothetical protein